MSKLTINTDVKVLGLFAGCIHGTTLVAGLVSKTSTLYLQNLTPVGDLQVWITKEHQPRNRCFNCFSTNLTIVTIIVNDILLEGTYFLSLYHWIVGKGTPCTLHSRLISCFTMAETSWGEADPTMVGGTGANKILYVIDLIPNYICVSRFVLSETMQTVFFSLGVSIDNQSTS